MKTLLTACVQLALALAISPLCCGASYYVAKNGKDSNPGTDQEPWLTIQKAAGAMMPGDTVFVGSGTYDERVQTVRNGASASLITFRAPRGAQMKGFVVKHSFIRIQGFEMEGNCTAAYDGAIYLAPAPVRNIEILDNHFHDIGTNINAIRFKDGKGFMAEDAAALVTIRGNTFLRGHGHTMQVYGLNHVIEGNLIEDTGGKDAIVLFGRGTIIRSNVFRNVSKGTTLFHTDLVQTFGASGPYESRDMTFEKNIAFDCDAQVCNLEQQGAPLIGDYVFRNNVFLNQSMAANIYIPGVKFYNNTFFRTTRNTGHVLVYNSSVKGSAARGEVLNNIFFECGSKPANTGFGWYSADTNLVDFQADHNFVCGTEFAPKKTGATRSLFVFSEEHGINGGDPGFVALDTRDVRLRPESRLIDRGVSLLGILNGGFSDDAKSILRSQGAGWDLGAYEYSPPPSVVSGVTVE